MVGAEGRRRSEVHRWQGCAETAVAARSFRKRTVSESNMNKQKQPEKRKRKVGLFSWFSRVSLVG